MSEIPPAPNPVPHQEPPTITPLTPSWSYPFNILLLLAGVIVALVVVYLTYRLLVKNRSASNGRLTALHGFAILIGGSESTILPRALISLTSQIPGRLREVLEAYAHTL